jgi:hypothetical protein
MIARQVWTADDVCHLLEMKIKVQVRALMFFDSFPGQHGAQRRYVRWKRPGWWPGF